MNNVVAAFLRDRCLVRSFARERKRREVDCSLRSVVIHRQTFDARVELCVRETNKQTKTKMILRFCILVALFSINGVRAAERYPPRARPLQKYTMRELEQQHRRLKTYPKEEPDDDDDDDGDNSEDKTMSPGPTLHPPPPVPELAAPTTFPTSWPTATPTVVPTVLPTTNPTSTPTANPTELPTAVPTTITAAPSKTIVPTKTPTTKPTAGPVSTPENEDDSDVSSTPATTTAATTTATTPETSTVTKDIDLQTFSLTVSWEEGFVTVESLTQRLELYMKDFFAREFDSPQEDFLDVVLFADAIDARRQRRQLQGNQASIEYRGTASFGETSVVTEQQVWDAQTSFLREYTLPDSGNVKLESTTVGDDVFYQDDGTTVETETIEDTVDRDVGDQITDTTTSSSAESTAGYGSIVGALAAGTLIAVLGGVYYVRRNRSNERYQAHEGYPPEYYEVDPEDNSTLPGLPGKAVLRVDTNDNRSGLTTDLTTPTTQGSSSSDKQEADPLSPSSSKSGEQSSHNQTDEQVSCQASLISGTLASVAEEQSQDMSMDSNEELVAEAGDENFDVSMMVDADEEFAAVSGTVATQNKEPSAHDGVVDPNIYTQWVTPLLRQLEGSTRDCCLKGATQNVMDTTMPHDLLMSDIELAQQRELQADGSVLDPTFKATFDDSPNSDTHETNSAGKTTDAKNAGSEEGPLGSNPKSCQRHPDDESNGENVECPLDETQGEGEEDENADDALRLYSGKYHSHPAIFQRTPSALASEDSSLNLSQQASFMTDDLDMGAELLEKAVRDVALYNPEEELDSKYQVSEYMHQVRKEAKEYQKNKYDEDVKEVTL